MTVLVDPLFTATPRHPAVRRLGTRWCHMFAEDPLDEVQVAQLHAIAARIGLQRAYYDEGASMPHYDLTPDWRDAALVFGAVECTKARVVQCMRAYRARKAGA